MTGPLPSCFTPLIVPLSWGYGAAVSGRNARFDRGEGVTRLDRPVISIGNMTAGGTGKSPMTRWLARGLVERGRKPVIAMRGYKARREGLSDEQAEYRRLLPHVPVVAHPDRTAALQAHFTNEEAGDVVLLDDGFQHRQLHRDLDLVLIDATADTFDQRLLPAGFLREPLESLRRADAVIVTRATRVSQELAERIEQYHGRPPIAWSRHTWSELLVVEGGGSSSTRPLDWLRHRSIVTMLGVGNPEPIVDELRSRDVQEITSIPCRDHERFSGSKIRRAERLCERGATLVMTLKDWLRHDVRLFDQWPGAIAVPIVEIEFIAGPEALRAMVNDALSRAAGRQA